MFNKDIANKLFEQIGNACMDWVTTSKYKNVEEFVDEIHTIFDEVMETRSYEKGYIDGIIDRCSADGEMESSTVDIILNLLKEIVLDDGK